MRITRAGLATKLMILLLLAAASLSLISMRTQLQTTRLELDALQQQVYCQTEINAGLAEDIAAAGDPSHYADIAREKLDLVEPGERVFASTEH